MAENSNDRMRQSLTWQQKRSSYLKNAKLRFVLCFMYVFSLAQKDAFDKSPRDIIDEAIVSLDLEKSSAQLLAIQSLNRILDPFVRQIATLVSCESFGQTLSSADKLGQCVAIFRNIFHPESPQVDLNIQLGTLLSAVHRLCRAAQDSRLGPALIKLSENLIKVAFRLGYILFLLLFVCSQSSILSWTLLSSWRIHDQQW